MSGSHFPRHISARSSDEFSCRNLSSSSLVKGYEGVDAAGADDAYSIWLRTVLQRSVGRCDRFLACGDVTEIPEVRSAGVLYTDWLGGDNATVRCAISLRQPSGSCYRRVDRHADRPPRLILPVQTTIHSLPAFSHGPGRL